MIQDTRQAKRLCTAEEFKLYQASLGGRLERLSPTDLDSRRRRTRTLRDKYRDVYRRQRGGARGKLTEGRTKEIHDFDRTWQKAELFKDALERFEARLQVLEMEHRRQDDEARRRSVGRRRQADREGRRVQAARVERESHLGRPPNETGPRPEFGATPPRPGRPIQLVSARGASGHYRSSNRRFQARRDSRR